MAANVSSPLTPTFRSQGQGVPLRYIPALLSVPLASGGTGGLPVAEPLRPLARCESDVLGVLTETLLGGGFTRGLFGGVPPTGDLLEPSGTRRIRAAFQ